MARTREEYNAYQRDYQRRRYERRMAEARERLGGRCVRCGRTERLHLHHIDETTKEHNISAMHLLSQARFDAELAKCELQCAWCHPLTTVYEQGIIGGGHNKGKRQPPPYHGTAYIYSYYGCRCDPCREARRAKAAEERARAKMRREAA